MKLWKLFLALWVGCTAGGLCIVFLPIHHAYVSPTVVLDAKTKETKLLLEVLQQYKDAAVQQTSKTPVTPTPSVPPAPKSLRPPAPPVRRPPPVRPIIPKPSARVFREYALDDSVRTHKMNPVPISAWDRRGTNSVQYDITHVIQTFTPRENSHWHLEIETWKVGVRRAVALAAERGIKVEVLLVLFEEDLAMADEPPFQLGRVLERGLRSECNKLLPFQQDVIETAELAGSGSITIFSHADIIPYPRFYTRVHRLVGKCTASSNTLYSITRNVLVGKYTGSGDYNLMLREKGKKHPGTDCVVACKGILNKVNLKNLVIGAPPNGCTMRMALDKQHRVSQKIIQTSDYTFHLGDSARDYAQGSCVWTTYYNMAESYSIMTGSGSTFSRTRGGVACFQKPAVDFCSQNGATKALARNMTRLHTMCKAWEGAGGIRRAAARKPANTQAAGTQLPFVLVCGMTRGGSTWLYNVLYRVVKHHYGDSTVFSDVNDPRHVNLAAKAGKVPIVYKVHDPNRVQGTQLATHTFTVRRNARDTLASNIRFFNLGRGVEAANTRMAYLERVYRVGGTWPNHVYEMCYQDKVEDEVAVIMDIANIVLPHGIPRDVAERISQNLSAEPGKGNKLRLAGPRHMQREDDQKEYVTSEVWEKIEPNWKSFIDTLSDC